MLHVTALPDNFYPNYSTFQFGSKSLQKTNHRGLARSCLQALLYFD